jgi:hypothetical protein
MRTFVKVLSLLAAVGMLALSPAEAQGNASPRADFRTTPTNPDTNTPVLFDASGSKDPDGSIVKYEWDFNGDGRFDEMKTTPTTTRLFDRAGDWRINLRVTDNRGATGSISKIVRIAESAVTTRRQITLPPGGQVTTGQTVRVTVHVRINQAINGLGLDEDPPSGWAARESQNAGALFKKAELQWLWAQRLQAGQTLTVVYELIVPPGTPAGLFKLSGQLTSFSPRFSVPVVGDAEIRVF